ncbi:MAG: DoxX family protein [Acidimicrobiales bacterium]
MSEATASAESPTRRRSRRALSGLLCFMGTVHFLVPRPFDRLIPKWVPGAPRFWTYASGAAELASGLLVSQPRTRRLGAALAAATIVGVYPANVQMALDNPPRTVWGIGAWLRLPMQLPLIGWALSHTRR